jgi:predicted lactoylglutathione lyase
VVDERFRWARDRGLEIENEPQEWPYMPGYYATFFHDLDGLMLEVVFVP